MKENVHKVELKYLVNTNEKHGYMCVQYIQKKVQNN